MKVREVLQHLHRDGWRIVRQKGSHRQLRHSVKPGRVTVAGAPGKDIVPATLLGIWKQAQMRRP
jgi:predicted RNA binding protein YcfA (HicA-like mRNA interferase family)